MKRVALIGNFGFVFLFKQIVGDGLQSFVALEKNKIRQHLKVITTEIKTFLWKTPSGISHEVNPLTLVPDLLAFRFGGLPLYTLGTVLPTKSSNLGVKQLKKTHKNNASR